MMLTLLKKPFLSTGCLLATTISLLLLPLSAQASSATDALTQLETQHHLHIGLSVRDENNRSLLSHHGSERFPLNSTFKALVCARIWQEGSGDRKAQVRDGGDVAYAPVLEKLPPHHPISLTQACDAALRVSDNRAANLLLAHTGGPLSTTAWLRSEGDAVTRLDRNEPTVNDWVQGEVRDTTTPEAITQVWAHLSNNLPEPARTTWFKALNANETSQHLLRSLLSQGWTVDDRTGSGLGTRAIHARLTSPTHHHYFVAVHQIEVEATQATMNEKQRREKALSLQAKDARLKDALRIVSDVVLEHERSLVGTTATKP